MEDPQEVAPGIYSLEGKDGQTFQWPATYFVQGEYTAIVESGPTRWTPHILDALARLGWARDTVRYIIPTHIHLDHGGGAGFLAQELPQAKVVVYHKAARHLADPAKLIEGTRQAFGPNFEEEFGPILPVPPERLLPVDEGDRVDLGGRELEFYHTPGHAYHHIGTLDRKTRALFCGEALGRYVPEIEAISPSVALPVFDVAQARETIAKLQRVKPKLLLFAQYGVSRDPERVFRLARESLDSYAGTVRDALRQSLSEEEIAQRLEDLERADVEASGRQPLPGHWLRDYRQAAAGLAAYFRRNATG